tara:strand:+ start:527 stop:967 length:441 start_codon:yes stop_codon:yes gene_type:complete
MTDEKKTETTEAPAPEATAPEAEPTAPAAKAAAGSNGAAEEPADELLIGELLPQEMLAIQQVKGRINQHLMEIGHMEVQKAMTLAKLDNLESQGQQVIKDARIRLGIDEGVTLQVTPDGKVRRVPPNMNMDNVVPMHPGQAPPTAG